MNGCTNTTTKIMRVERLPALRQGPALLAYSGNAARGLELRDWCLRGAVPKDFPPDCRKTDEWAALLVIQRGLICRFETSPIAVEFEDRTFAMGSGRDFALAAMHMGKTAREAVEVACALDPSSGNGIDTLTLEIP